MKARDVMTLAVYTVKPTTSVKDVAHLFVERRISAAPVVDDQRKIVGIVSEGDLVHRSEISTQRRHPWWLVLMAGDEGLAADYIKAHAKQVADIMTRKVITAGPDTPLQEIAEMLAIACTRFARLTNPDELPVADNRQTLEPYAPSFACLGV